MTQGELVRLATSGRSATESLGRLRTVRTTAYSDAEKEMGGIYRDLSAAGTKLKYGMVRSAAADWSLYPLGTKFRIIGLPYTYVVDDYGSALVGTGTIDIYKPNLALMRQWGVRNVRIQVLEVGCYQQSLALLKGRTYAPHCRQMISSIESKTRRSGTVGSGYRRNYNES